MYVVGYPKSGNSWLCYLLSYCLNAEFDDFDNPGIYPRSKYIRQFVKGGLEHRSYQEHLGKILKTHTTALPHNSSQSLVYLVRDGRDVMVSYFHYEYGYKCTLPIFERYLPIKSILHRFKWRLVTKYYKPDFSTYLRKRLHEWVLHIKIYHELGYSALVRYEELLASPQMTLEKILFQVGAEVEMSVIQMAVEIFEFSKLAQRKQGIEDSQSFYRKGISGDWQNYFSEADLAYFYQTASGVLNRLEYK